ncbi:MAG: hypothetical protein AAB847_01470, partial [Patescibacteria group bacterium]
MKNFLKKIINYLNFSHPIGCLEISDSFLRFLRIDGKKIYTAVLRLPPGIVEKGMVKDRKNLIVALNQIYKQIDGAFHKPIPSIVSIGANSIYTQIFSLPYLALNKINEAAKLNLQMISPIDVKNVYSDWQIVGEELVSGSGQLELLGAFVSSDIAEEYLKVLKAANFSIAALEFLPLSLARVIKKLSVGIDLTKPQIVLFVGSEGLDFIILKNGNLYFNRFVSWQDNTSGAITMEMQKVINFYYGRWGEVINNLILVSANEVTEVNNALKNLNLNVQSLSFNKDQLPPVDATWLVALGGALRGLLSRAEDNLISLTSLGSKEEYRRNKISYFVGVWRNALITTVGAILICFMAAFGFLYSINKNLASRLQMTSNIKIPTSLLNLQDTIKDFNNLVAQAIKAKGYSVKWLPVLNNLWITAGQNISITRMHFDSISLVMLIGGSGISEIEVINFKNRLVKNENFESVNLPLSQIIKEGDKISFQMSMKVKKKS